MLLSIQRTPYAYTVGSPKIEKSEQNEVIGLLLLSYETHTQWAICLLYTSISPYPWICSSEDEPDDRPQFLIS